MPNAQNLRTPSTSEARAMQKKSAQKRSQNIKEKKLLKEIIEQRMKNQDINEIVDNLIERAKINSKDFETLRDTIGQKPTEKVEVATIDQNVIDEVENIVNDKKSSR